MVLCVCVCDMTSGGLNATQSKLLRRLLNYECFVAKAGGEFWDFSYICGVKKCMTSNESSQLV